MPTASERSRLAAEADIPIDEDDSDFALARPIDAAHKLLRSREAWAIKKVTRWADSGELEVVRIGTRRDRMVTHRSIDALMARWAAEAGATPPRAS